MENQLLFTLSCCENRENGASSESERIAPSPPWRENRSLLCRELRYFFRRKKASASRHSLSIAGKLPERRPVLSRRGWKAAPCSAENSGTFPVRKKASASRHFLSTTGKLPERRPVLSRRGGKTAPYSVENSGTFSVRKKASASRHSLSIAGKLPERRPVLSRRDGKTAPCSVENSGTFFR